MARRHVRAAPCAPRRSVLRLVRCRPGDVGDPDAHVHVPVDVAARDDHHRHHHRVVRRGQARSLPTPLPAADQEGPQARPDARLGQRRPVWKRARRALARAQLLAAAGPPPRG
eukprot:932180-Prymnesium_polylepis.1